LIKNGTYNSRSPNVSQDLLGTTLNIEYYPDDPPDPSATESVNHDAANLASDSAAIGPISGLDLPIGYAWTYLDGTDFNSHYRYRVRACNGTGCSAFTDWWYYTEFDLSPQ
jgi:hypothetical protein